jgi:uncharacterized protein
MKRLVETAGSSDAASKVSQQTARRFILGRQGLWPGRRWQGRAGLDPAVRYVGSVQFDPLEVVAHSQDLVLWGRILDYRADHLEDALYSKRTLYETGGNVQIRPTEERPFYAVIRRRKVRERRWADFSRANARLIANVLRELERRGPLGPGDVAVPGEARIQNYRARKLSGLALYYLWLRGDVMIALRRRGEKVFDLTSRLLSREKEDVPVDEAEEHLILQTLRELGLSTSSEWLAHAHTRIGRSTLRNEWRNRIRRWQKEGVIIEVQVEGWVGSRWLVAEAALDLEALRSSKVPRAWRPRSTTTDEEAIFFSPLEWTTARGRATRLFDFNYVWEAYKPASARRWGYYTLPVLFGDRLCARVELRYLRESKTLRVLGYWPEEAFLRRDSEFALALGRAFVRLADFLGATKLDPTGLSSRPMQQRVLTVFRRE